MFWSAAALVTAYVAVDQLNEADRHAFAGREKQELYWLGALDFAVAGAGAWLAWRLLRAPTRRVLGYSGLLGALTPLAAVVQLAVPEAPREASIAAVFALGAAVASLLARPDVPAAASTPAPPAAPPGG